MHFARNLLVLIPKAHQDMVAALFRTVFAGIDANAVAAKWDHVRATLAERWPKATALMDNARPEVLAFCAFPVEHWRKIWSTNPLERVNKEIKRRSRVVGIFPNEASVIRLVGAVLADLHDDSISSDRRYLSEASMAKLDPEREDPPRSPPNSTPATDPRRGSPSNHQPAGRCRHLCHYWLDLTTAFQPPPSPGCHEIRQCNRAGKPGSKYGPPRPPVPQSCVRPAAGIRGAAITIPPRRSPTVRQVRAVLGVRFGELCLGADRRHTSTAAAGVARKPRADDCSAPTGLREAGHGRAEGQASAARPANLASLPG